MKKHNDQQIRDVLTEFALQKQLKEKLLLTKIKSYWHNNMAFGITRGTQKIEFRNQTLILHVTSAPLRQELLIHKSLIIEKLNKHLGNSVIKKISLVGS